MIDIALYTSTIKYLINLINNLSQSTKEKDIKSMDGKIINENLRSEPTTKKGFTYYCNEYLFSRLWDGYNPKILEKKQMKYLWIQNW